MADRWNDLRQRLALAERQRSDVVLTRNEVTDLLALAAEVERLRKVLAYEARVIEQLEGEAS